MTTIIAVSAIGVIKKLIKFVATQGTNVDLKLTKEVYDALNSYWKNSTINDLFRLEKEIKQLPAGDSISFIGQDRLKFICSSMLSLFATIYRRGYYYFDILDLIDMMLRKPDLKRIEDILNVLLSTGIPEIISQANDINNLLKSN